MPGATTLLGSLVSKLDASPVGTALASAGGTWVGGIPEDKPSLPFLAVLEHSERPLWSEAACLTAEDGNFVLAVYEIGLQQAEALAGLVKTLLDPPSPAVRPGFVELDIADVGLCYVKRLDYRVRLAPWKAQDGRHVFEILMPFATYLQNRAGT